MKTYIIRAGFTFLMPDNSVKAGGEKIQLDDDVAAQHLHKLEEEQPEAKPKKAAAKPAAPTEQVPADSTAPAADPVVDPAAAADPS